ncbi:MAG: histidine kinase dimerization/phosphoacceptor domain -containing protein [Candidatus Hydrothermarchaeales archaeon]
MKEYKRVFTLILIMTIVSLAVVSIAIQLLYQTALEEERARLVETAHSRARLIEAVARFDAIYSTDYPGGAQEATLSQIVDAHEKFEGFGKTGEFTLARRDGDNIEFLLTHRHSRLTGEASTQEGFEVGFREPISFDSGLAEPMRQALLGHSGTIIGLDYRGEEVLAAYEPVGELDLGIVAKIDLAEVKAPFVNASIVVIGATVLLVLLGAVLFLRISNPMIRQMEENAIQLRQMNVELGELADERSRELREKEVLLKEIHHRVKNNLQVISTMIDLQSMSKAGKPTTEVFKDIQGRIRAMALVHEKLYESEGLSEIRISNYLNELTAFLFQTYNVSPTAVKTKIDVEDVFLNIDPAIPCGLIINELVTNSLTHAFPGEREGEILVSLKSAKGKYNLKVSDNGVGMPDGVDFRNPESLGLQLVDSFVGQIDGTVRLDRKGGTTVIISFGQTRGG